MTVAHSCRVERKGSSNTVHYMQLIYEKVAATGHANYSTAHCQLCSNLRFSMWEALIHEPQYVVMVDCLKVGFPVGYQGPIPTPTEFNHTLAILHPGDIVAYISKEVNVRATTLHLLVPGQCPHDKAIEGQHSSKGNNDNESVLATPTRYQW